MAFSQDGFELIENFLSEAEISQIADNLSNTPSFQRSGCIRHADQKFPVIHSLVNSPKLLATAKIYLNSAPTLVRVILFDKTTENNWLVSWHQDKTLSLSNKLEIEGWGPWSVKDGSHHVQPPAQALDQMVTFRIHLDDSTSETGCLRLIPGSHLNGILPKAALLQVVRSNSQVMCSAKAGSLLVMKPLLVHASSKATKPAQRRVIHIEYSGYDLPGGLQWISPARRKYL